MTELISGKNTMIITVELDESTLKKLHDGRKVILDSVSKESVLNNFQVHIYNSDFCEDGD